MNSNTIIILGLGNPGTEYEQTRHNAGRNAVLLFANNYDLPEFKADNKLQALTSEGALGAVSVIMILPETFMNKSGETVKKLWIKNKKQIANSFIAVHDDLDLPIGSIKIVKNRGSAGHKGVESVMHSLGTQDFTRIRIGIAKQKDITKSQSKPTVHNIVIGKSSPEDRTLLKKGVKRATEALAVIVEKGVPAAMNAFNG